MPVHFTTRESLRMFNLADIWAARTAAAVRLVSANDHVHARRSAHYAGLALDFQSSNPDGLSSMFRLAGYRVLWKVPGHYGHVHVEQERSGAAGDGRAFGEIGDQRFAARTTNPRTGVPASRRNSAYSSVARKPIFASN